jgi:hypothetical protein
VPLHIDDSNRLVGDDAFDLHTAVEFFQSHTRVLFKPSYRSS